MDKIFQFRKATLKDTKNTEVMSFDQSTKVMSAEAGEPSLADEIKAKRRAEIEEKIEKFKDVKKSK